MDGEGNVDSKVASGNVVAVVDGNVLSRDVDGNVLSRDVDGNVASLACSPPPEAGSAEPPFKESTIGM